MTDICKIIPVIPQNFMTCCLYSDGLSAIVFQKAIEDRWWESVIKIYML